MENKELLQLLSQAKSDDFISIGDDDWKVLGEFASRQDKILLLKALQIAFALGRRSVVRGMTKVESSADFAIRELIGGQK